ncbi:sulfite exporter TauE/SafE family protein, partial [bacterium]|nr:sulfite exporter TauE/SafE family protein [bacterium]
AGGGTILTFPALAAILPPDPARLVVANATSTIGLWPGALSAAWASRGDRAGQQPFTRWLVVPSVAGALVGAWLVVVLPPAWFAATVPWLILVAAVLFALQPRIVRLAARRPANAGATTAAGAAAHLPAACVLQFAVAVYGGYFGAGIGIMMLAMLGFLGLGDIHRLNAVKNVLGTVVNGVAALFFAVGSCAGSHAVSWPHAAVMAVGACGGGLVGSLVARRLPAPLVRRGVALIAFALAGYYFAT